MKKLMLCFLISGVLFLLSYGANAKTKDELELSFPKLNGNEINLSLPPFETASQIIYFRIDNPQRELVQVKVKMVGEHKDYLDYQLYDIDPLLAEKYIIENIAYNSFKTAARNYEGWLKIDFKQFNNQWWELKAGQYNYRIIFTVKKIWES